MSILNYLFNAPLSDWLWFAGLLLGIMGLIGLTEVFHKNLHGSPEVTRKFLHVAVGLLVGISPFVFQSPKAPLWLAVIFIILNILSLKKEALDGMNKTERITYGTVLFPVAFFILILTCWGHHNSVFIMAMFIMAISDTMASIIGERISKPHVYRWGLDSKSVEGSLAMGISTFILVAVLFPFLMRMDGFTLTYPTILWAAVATAILCTVLEGLSGRGSDNLTVPLGAALVLGIFVDQSFALHIQFTIGMGLALVTAFLSWKAGFVTSGGAAGTFLLGTVIFGIGGWMWALPILFFFLSSSLLSKLGKAQKQKFKDTFQKSSQRDLMQVAANGGLAGVICLIHFYFPESFWYIGYLTVLAAVNGDTWATELGVMSKTQPRSIVTWQVVPPGTSGGITFLGTLGALAGAFFIIGSGVGVLLFLKQEMPASSILILAGFSGFLGTLLDSYLGGTLQGQYQCPACQKQTEKRKHCDGQKTILKSGFHWMDNDAVNLLCSLGGLLVIGIVFLIIG